MKDIHLSTVELNPLNSIRRAMPRKPHLRQPDYEEKFDFMTVFYDCFRSADPDWSVLLGPPLINLEPIVIPTLPKLFRCRSSADMRLNSKAITRLWLRTAEHRTHVESGEFRQAEITIQPNHCDMFQDRKVLLTLSKNNDLCWIGDWVRFFAKTHGCDAVLFYDNASTKYDISDLYETISSIPGIEVVVVVHWPYVYGPQGSDATDPPPKRPWDSAYSQVGVLGHARHRFLSLAAAVVNADVDELVLTRDKESVFELAIRSATGLLRYPGYWIENAAKSVGERPRHFDFCFRAPDSEESPAKWTIVPSRCPPDSTWLPHRDTEMEADPLSSLVSFRHFRAINTSWKYQRDALKIPDEQYHIKDHEIEEWMQVLKPRNTVRSEG